jgi:hypothetical protein
MICGTKNGRSGKPCPKMIWWVKALLFSAKKREEEGRGERE